MGLKKKNANKSKCFALYSGCYEFQVKNRKKTLKPRLMCQ